MEKHFHERVGERRVRTLYYVKQLGGIKVEKRWWRARR